MFLIFLYDSATFFHYCQIKSRCHLYWFDMYKSDNTTFHSHNGWIFKVIQAVSVVIWKESELIRPVWILDLKTGQFQSYLPKWILKLQVVQYQSITLFCQSPHNRMTDFRSLVSVQKLTHKRKTNVVQFSNIHCQTICIFFWRNFKI